VFNKFILLNKVYKGINLGSIGIMSVQRTIMNKIFFPLNCPLENAYPARREAETPKITELTVTMVEFIYDLISLPFSNTIP
jgi:hypothetical protein